MYKLARGFIRFVLYFKAQRDLCNPAGVRETLTDEIKQDLRMIFMCNISISDMQETLMDGDIL